jgi:urocanate hydratase
MHVKASIRAEVPDFPARVALVYEKLAAPSEERGPGDERGPAEAGLGGKLFYAGELDEEGRALIVAANIAGAATLVASGDLAAQKQAIRDGVADFPVNSLDEALRILKNQLRKRETVAVCVAMEPAAMEREMSERGVAADLLRRDVGVADLHEAFILQPEGQNQSGFDDSPALVIWRAASANHRDLAALDEIALACLDANDWARRRWVRLAPRYLGRSAHGLRVLSTRREFVARFEEQLRLRVERGEIAFPCEIRFWIRGTEKGQCFNGEKP